MEWDLSFLSRHWLGAVGGVGVTAEALRRRNDRSHLQHLNSDVKSTGLQKLIKILEETPGHTFLNLGVSGHCGGLDAKK
jgi:hypothetical protein